MEILSLLASRRPAIDGPVEIRGRRTIFVVPVKWVGVAAIVAVAVGGLGIMAGRRTVDSPSPATATSKAAPAGETAGDLVEFRHEQAGFALSYPSAWTRLESTDPQVALVAAEKDPAENRGGSILVRVIQLGAPVGREQLAEARKVTDGIVTSGEGVELKAQPAEIEQGGLPGYFYLYTFKDQASGGRGAHSHYFLFKGDTMITVIFQGLPEEDFVRLASLFDRVAASFRVLSPKG